VTVDSCRETEENKMSLMIDGMGQTIRGERSFGDTPSGVAHLTGKRSFGAQQYEAMVRQYEPLYKAKLICP
jgi:hypothetical protein